MNYVCMNLVQKLCTYVAISNFFNFPSHVIIAIAVIVVMQYLGSVLIGEVRLGAFMYEVRVELTHSKGRQGDQCVLMGRNVTTYWSPQVGSQDQFWLP